MARTRETINAEAAADGATPRPKPDKRSRKRLSIYLNDDGTPDWESAPDEIRSAVGGAAPAPQPAPEPAPPIDPAIVGFMLQTMTRIESAIVGPRMGLTASEAYGALEPPAPLAEGLCTAGAAVLNKYSGSFGRWQEEIVLASLIVSWQASAFSEMRSMAAAKPKPEPQPAPPDKHVVIESAPVEAAA